MDSKASVEALNSDTAAIDRIGNASGDVPEILSSVSHRDRTSGKSPVASVSHVIKGDAVHNPTPFGLNRFLLLPLCFYTVLTARVHFGWPDLSSMLFRSGAFSWLCTEENLIDPATRQVRYLCEKQDSAVQLLFTVGAATGFTFSLLAGSLLDWKGPKLTGCIGQCISAVAWILLGVSNEDCQLYIPAFVLMGLGSDMGFLPVMSIANLFPGNEGLIVALMIAGLSASFGVPAIMQVIWNIDPSSVTFSKLAFGYTVMGPGLSFLISLCVFPVHPYESKADLNNDNIDTCRSFRSFAPQSRRGSVVSVADWKEAKDAVVELIVGDSGDVHESDRIILPSATTQSEASHETGLVEIYGRRRSRRRSAYEDTSQMGDNGESRKLDLAEKIECHQVNPIRELTHRTAGVPNEKPRFIDQLRSWYFILFYIYWPLNCMFYSFYVTAAENMLGSQVNDFLGKMNPLSMIPSILLGRVVDVWGVMTMIIFITLMASLMYAFAIPQAIGYHYASTVFCVMYVSMFSGQMYSFVGDTFEAAHFGKFVGILSATGGLLSLVRYPLYEVIALQVLNREFSRVAGMMLGFVGIAALCVAGLTVIKRRKRFAYV
eukprot:GHVQ01014198.1.p1 GENE.GHVQ01014198.1~~GHVQ01014198.1.p1  ORF type:complete len:602 (+),score=41.56 GHVQ01014198.1:201-2006(+)